MHLVLLYYTINIDIDKHKCYRGTNMTQYWYDKKDAASILRYAEQIKGKRMGDFLPENITLNSNNKGNVGQLVEKEYFGISTNSEQAPDFPEAELELKVTPLKMLKAGKISAKERLKITSINYKKNHNVDFYESHLYAKMRNMLLVTYLPTEDKDIKKYLVIDTFIYNIPKEDLSTILEDYQIIQDMIASGKAHEISESMTSYLAACTSGSGKTLAAQPFNTIQAKQRAWSLKPSYMTYLYTKQNNNDKSILGKDGESLSEVINSRLSKYIGFSETELSDHFNIVSKSKSKFQLFASSMFGIKGTKLENSKEFKKASIKLKTVRVENNGKIREDMSFETLKFSQIPLEKTFQESELFEIFALTSYLILYFKMDSRGEYCYEGFRHWKLNADEVDMVEVYWKSIKKALSEKLLIQPILQKNGARFQYPTLPTSKKNSVFHCRTKGAGKNKSGTYSKLTESAEVEVLHPILSSTVNNYSTEGMERLPEEGKIHSMCTFVSSKKIEELFKF